MIPRNNHIFRNHIRLFSAVLIETIQSSQPSLPNHRVSLFQKLKRCKPPTKSSKIEIKLMDGRIIHGMSNLTTPLAVCLQLGKSLAEKSLVARVNGMLYDMNRPLEGILC
jgi:threonyl-tRNA synthetase